MGLYRKVVVSSKDTRGYIPESELNPKPGNEVSLRRYICHSCGSLVEPGSWCSVCGRELTNESDNFEDVLDSVCIDSELVAIRDLKTKDILGCPKCHYGHFKQLNTKNLVKCVTCGRIIALNPITGVKASISDDLNDVYIQFVHLIPSEAHGIVHWCGWNDKIKNNLYAIPEKRNAIIITFSDSRANYVFEWLGDEKYDYYPIDENLNRIEGDESDGTEKQAGISEKA